MRISVEALSDVGLVRELNEDSFRVLQEQSTVLVCDGMGGHAAGEVASATAAETISDWIRHGELEAGSPTPTELGSDWPPEAIRLAAAVRLANRRLYNEAARSHKLRGMGTTVAAALFKPGTVITAHVGDSRVYRITGERIEQLTVDHSWVAELLESGQVRPEDVEHFADKNVITRALGTRPGVQVDLGIHPAQSGDIYLVCSDGLCGYVDDDEIHRQVMTNAADLKQAALALVGAANAAGGLDNSTVALVRVDDAGSSRAPAIESVTLAEETESDLARLDTVLLGRYKEGAGTEDHTEGHKEPTGSTSESTLGRRLWQWLVLLLLLGALIAAFLWSRRSDPEPAPDSTHSQLSTPAAPVPDAAPLAESPGADLALLFVAAGHADRSAAVWLDGVAQGRLHEVESGLLVEPGAHSVVVLDSFGDTVLSQAIRLSAHDTLDLKVR